MIKRLAISNYAIIEEVEVEFSENLTIITGETGAGKSIMLGALGLIMGDRADTKSLNNPHRKCIIEGYFDILHYDLKDLFDEHDLDYDTEVVLRREITPSGKSRAFINDTPARLPILRDISLKLLDVHRQFDTLDIQSESFQLKMLDALADNKKTLEAYTKIYKSYQSNKRQLQQLVTKSEQEAKEVDFLLFQLEELSTAELQADEQLELENDLAKLTNAESIKQNLSGAYVQIIESELSIIGSLREMSNQIETVKDYHQELNSLHSKFEGLIYELEDAANEFNRISEETEYDEERIQELNERLDLIYKLQNKHKVNSIAELLEIQEDLANRTEGFTDLNGQIVELENAIDEQENELREIAGILSERRGGKVEYFQKQVHQLLAELSMPHAQLKINLSELEELTNTGLNAVQFMFTANKGGRLDLIKNVASGGELSRLALCTKSLVASAIPLPTLIFDEIDSGVSGDVAQRMAKILKKLSKEHQVVSITHTPQIAAKADKHYFVYKEAEGETTKSHIKLLNRDERIQEIAIMLSGNPPSEYAISNAVDLID
jgi:DNA repair protein RecN (Recombination protein N)